MYLILGLLFDPKALSFLFLLKCCLHQLNVHHARILCDCSFSPSLSVLHPVSLAVCTTCI